MVLAQRGLRHVPPLAAAGISVPVTALAFWLASFFLLDLSRASGAAILIFALVGLFFPAALTVLNFLATDRLGPSATVAVSSTTPLFAMLGALVLIREIPDLRQIGATAAIVAGVTLASGWSGGAWKWIALPLAAALMRGIAIALTKFGFAWWPDPFAAALCAYTVSGSLLFFAGKTERERNALQSLRALPWFAAVGLMNGGGVLAMNFALQSGSVGTVSPIVAGSPLFALALSALWLRGERITPRLIAGVALTVGGVALLTLA